VRVKQHILTGHNDSVTCACFVTSDTIASGSDDRKIKFWDARLGNCLFDVPTRSKCYDLTTDGLRTIASAHMNPNILLYDVTMRREVFSIATGHTSQLTCVTYSPGTTHALRHDTELGFCA